MQYKFEMYGINIFNGARLGKLRHNKIDLLKRFRLEKARVVRSRLTNWQHPCFI